MSFEKNLEVAAQLIAVLKQDMKSRDDKTTRLELLRDVCDSWAHLDTLLQKQTEIEQQIQDARDELDLVLGRLQSDINYYPDDEE